MFRIASSTFNSSPSKKSTLMSKYFVLIFALEYLFSLSIFVQSLLRTIRKNQTRSNRCLYSPPNSAVKQLYDLEIRHTQMTDNPNACYRGSLLSILFTQFLSRASPFIGKQCANDRDKQRIVLVSPRVRVKYSYRRKEYFFLTRIANCNCPLCPLLRRWSCTYGGGRSKQCVFGGQFP